MTASVLVEVIRPAATLVMVRSAPDDPTLTVLVALAPAKPPKVAPLIATELVETVAAVIDPEPRAMLFALPAVAPLPMAMALLADAVATGPMAMELVPDAVESARLELVWKYLMPAPFASAFSTLTELLVVERPVDSDVTPLWALLMPLEDEVESDVA